MDYWDTAVEWGSTGCGASLKKLERCFRQVRFFLFNAVLRQP
jgi:hypothetical protein